jgi:serine/threonine protein kinase
MKSQYSTRSDIWALGCILHDIATGIRLFHDDFATQQYADGVTELHLRISYESPFWQGQVYKSIHKFLAKQPSQRPDAGQACRHLSAYSTVLSLPDNSLLYNVTLSPPDLEWETLVEPGLSTFGLLVELYLSRGRDEIYPELRKVIISKLGQSRRDEGADSTKDTQPVSTIKTGEDMEFWVKNMAVLLRLGETLNERQEYNDATLIAEGLRQYDVQASLDYVRDVGHKILEMVSQ